MMASNRLILMIVAAFLQLALLSQAQASSALYMQTKGRTSQPIGHYDYCKIYVADCAIVRANPKPVLLTPDLWKLLVKINDTVNTTIIPMSDMEAWGVEERWEYPYNGVGDCDDIVLEKRRQLVNKGVPVEDLLITVVRQVNGEGHALLTVNTTAGDFILDNLETKIRLWSDTEYSYLKRQSQRNSGEWEAIGSQQDILVSGTK